MRALLLIWLPGASPLWLIGVALLPAA